MSKKFVHKAWESVRVGSKVYKVLREDVSVLRRYAVSQGKSMGKIAVLVTAELEKRSPELVNARFKTGVYGVDQIKRAAGAIAALQLFGGGENE